MESTAQSMKSFRVIVGFLMLSLVATPAQTYRVIHSFTNSPDGAGPWGGLVLSDGVLYGTTCVGGTASPYGGGTVFKVGTNGTGYRRLCSLDYVSNPRAGLVLKDGVLYGTATGNPYNSSGGGISGYVFGIGTNGTGFTKIKDFSTGGGAYPDGKLLVIDSMLYGAAGSGGSSYGGVVFKVGTNGSNFTALKNFADSPDGSMPAGNLALDGSTLYGTTCWGGSASNGVVFTVDTNGTGYTILKSFSALNNGTNSDGRDPSSGLVLNGGTLYGAAYYGGAASNGVVFKLNTDGTGFTVLKHFSALINGTNSDGANPHGALILNGHVLYGSAMFGGASGSGVVFKLNTNGTGFAVLKHFSANDTNSDGAHPRVELMLDGSTLYGTTAVGGIWGGGVVFSLTVPPEILVNDGGFGIRTNCFGFNVTGISNLVVVMEASTNLTKTNWVPVKTNTLGSDAVYFGDSKWTNYPRRYYRVRAQ
jgi:uncharacterized repeat protein (TIGR03803 family)